METKLIGIQIKASNISRTYPKMQEVADSLKNSGYNILILDSQINGQYKYNVRQMAALIEQCDIIVCSNTIGYHLAGAMKKRAIALFGSCDGKIWTEDYEKVTPLQIDCPLGKKRCWWELTCLPGTTLREKEETKAPACLEKIPVSKVISEVEVQLHTKKVLIVVLTYNLLALTKQMIDSIRSTYNYEILVIDNESTDGTQQWVKSQGIQLIEKRQSVAAAWNMGLQTTYMSGYDYCLLCNNDIVLSPTYIDTVVEVAERRKAMAVTGQVIQKGAVPQTSFHEIVRMVEVSAHTMVAGDYSALLLSRECIKDVGKFDIQFAPRYQADEDHMLRIRLTGKEFEIGRASCRERV